VPEVQVSNLHDLLAEARTLSFAPISRFRVGAVVRGASGALYLGANLEIPGHPLSVTVHAEQAACANAYMHGENGIQSIAVTAAPCGYCRQFLNEFSPDGKLEVLIEGDVPVRLASLLPAAFGPADLGGHERPLPAHRVDIILPTRAPDPLVASALSAACISYAPYTHAHSGAAVQLSDGSIHRGAYIENAAFNPSLPPLEIALISVLAARRSLHEITDAVLIELEDKVVSQKFLADSALASICPNVRLRTIEGQFNAPSSALTRSGKQ
jgi:cytidine deaminase